jgi:hypothetical protein
MSIISSSKLIHHTFKPWSVEDRFGNYAEAISSRRTGIGGWGGNQRIVVDPERWQRPFDWNKAAEGASVFCLASVDVFANGGEQVTNSSRQPLQACEAGCCHSLKQNWEPISCAGGVCPKCSRPLRELTLDDMRAELFNLISQTRRLTWLLPTEYIKWVADRLPVGWKAQQWPHVWIGTVVRDQSTADRRIPILRSAPAAKRFVYYQPRGLINFQKVVGDSPLHSNIDWLIYNDDDSSHKGVGWGEVARFVQEQLDALNVAFSQFEQGDEESPE